MLEEMKNKYQKEYENFRIYFILITFKVVFSRRTLQRENPKLCLKVSFQKSNYISLSPVNSS